MRRQPYGKVRSSRIRELTKLNARVIIDSIYSTAAVNDFARRFSQRGGDLMWLLGAGASVAAGISTVGDMTWEFKQQLYVRQRRVSPNRSPTSPIRPSDASCNPSWKASAAYRLRLRPKNMRRYSNPLLSERAVG